MKQKGQKAKKDSRSKLSSKSNSARYQGPDSMNETFVRDVSTQFNQYNDLDLSKLTSSLRKTPPKIYYEAGNVRKSPSPVKNLRSSTLIDSQKIPSMRKREKK